jgi:hypothetical protein
VVAKKNWLDVATARRWTLPIRLPDDPNELKAMLLAERARNERLVQIIKEMQRHRFGRRAETPPEDQMLLALEEVEQTDAGAAAVAEAKSAADREKAARKRRTNLGALPAHLPRIETIVDIDKKGGCLHLVLGGAIDRNQHEKRAGEPPLSRPRNMASR